MRDCETGAVLGAQKIALIENGGKKRCCLACAQRGVIPDRQSRAPELWFVEGYATGLSVDAALKILRLGGSRGVCFSASNRLCRVSARGNAFVFADNDASGAGEPGGLGHGTTVCDGGDMDSRTQMILHQVARDGGGKPRRRARRGQQR